MSSTSKRLFTARFTLAIKLLRNNERFFYDVESADASGKRFTTTINITDLLISRVEPQNISMSLYRNENEFVMMVSPPSLNVDT